MNERASGGFASRNPPYKTDNMTDPIRSRRAGSAWRTAVQHSKRGRLDGWFASPNPPYV